MRNGMFGVLVVLGLVVASRGDDKPKSGPQPGELLPGPFHVYNVTGDRAGKNHCLVCRNGLNPAVALFVRPGAAEEVVADLLQKLDAAVAKHADVRMGAYAIFLNGAPEEDQAELIKQLEALAKEKEIKNVILAVAPAAGPQGYKIDENAPLTAVLYYRHRTKSNYTFTPDALPTEKDVEAIMQDVEKLIPPRAPPRPEPVIRPGVS
jgi:hypothetical protein